MSRYYGIDRTEVRNIDIIKIDLNKLLSKNTVVDISTIGELGYIVPNVNKKPVSLTRIKIVDNNIFNTFLLDKTVTPQGLQRFYTTLDLTIATKKNGKDNSRPLSLEAYKKYLEDIKSYLEGEYGVYIDISEARFELVEINITSDMDYPFYEYSKIFEAVINKRNMKKYPLPSIHIGETVEKPIGYELSSKKKRKGVQDNRPINRLKIYDKSTQLLNCMRIYKEDNQMRIEYVLRTKDLITKRLGTSKILDLTDQDIRDFLKNNIQEDIFKPVEAYISDSNKELKKRYRDLKKRYKRGYIRQFAQYSSQINVDILDMEQVIAIAKKDMSKSNNYTRNHKVIDEVMPSILKNNFNKLAELKAKFLLD